ncbi:MAG: hypothetical protein WD904_06425 [Dehalococcoidia bacterium]
MNTDRDTGLRFTFRATASGAVQIYHGDTLGTTLRGAAAKKFLAKVDDASDTSQQQIMARLTGNYKRGNERQARSHPRNVSRLSPPCP